MKYKLLIHQSQNTLKKDSILYGERVPDNAVVSHISTAWDRNVLLLGFLYCIYMI